MTVGDKWRFEKSISIGQLLTLTSMLVVMGGFFATLDKRVDLNAASIERNREVQQADANLLAEVHAADVSRIDRRVESDIGDIKRSLERLEDRMFKQE